MRRFKLLLLCLGLALLALMIHQIGLGNILNEISQLGFNIVFILIPYCFVYLLDALAWRTTLREKAKEIQFPNLFLTRMAGEAINYITPSAYLGGEPVKAYLLQKHGIPLVDGLASVVTAKTVMVIAQVFFVLLGIGLSFASHPNNTGIIYAAILIVILVSLAATFLVVAQHRGMFAGLLWLLELMRLPAGFLKRREDKLKDLDATILTFYGQHRLGFLLTLIFFFLGWLVGSLEIYLLLYYLDLSFDLRTAVSLEALVLVIRAAVFFIPSGLGAQEGGNILLFASFGFSPVTAMTFSIVRRMREVIWISIGLLYLAKQEIGVVQYREDG
ncbi:MAG: lysylphosphatidylglycerol synthase transmembrane domain-containing protein [Nitrospiria bacterium]